MNRSVYILYNTKKDEFYMGFETLTDAMQYQENMEYKQDFKLIPCPMFNKDRYKKL